MPRPSPFQPDCLAGRIALITGGGSGIGFEIARQLLRHGCHGVVLCGRRESFLQKACALLQTETPPTVSVSYHVTDVRDPAVCRDAVAHVDATYGRLDILVNAAAGNFLAAAKDLSPKGFATVLAIDALGTFNMCHAAYPLLSRRRDRDSNEPTALVLNLSATLQYGATWWQAHASAAKSAVDSLTRSLALEWGMDGIRVVGIAPGPIANTPGTTKLAPDTENAVATQIPLGRMGHAWEIGEAVVFLCVAPYVTGDVLVVDGGHWLYRTPTVPRERVAELSRKVERQSRAQAPQASL